MSTATEVWLLWEGQYEPSLRSIHTTKRGALKAMLAAKQAYAVQAFENSRRYGKCEFGSWWDRDVKTHLMVADYWVSPRDVLSEPTPVLSDLERYHEHRRFGYSHLRASHELFMANYKQWVPEGLV